MNISILGRGELGSAVVACCRAQGHGVQVLCRTPTAPGQHRLNLEDPVAAQVAGLEALPQATDLLLVCVAADAVSPEAYTRLYDQGLGRLAQALTQVQRPPARVMLVSSTAVWAAASGALDETSPKAPENFRGQCQLQAEAHLRASGCPVTVLYPGGIYGGAQGYRLLEAVRANRPFPLSASAVHRIQQDDLAAAIAHLIDGQALGQRLEEGYVLTDDAPWSSLEVLQVICALLAQPLPDWAGQVAGPVRPDRRFSNARLKASGFSFRYPTIRAYLMRELGLTS